jgi:NAD(P)H-nitrite reductase large subunit
VPTALLEPLPAGVETPTLREEDPAATICTCMAVTQGEIAAAIREMRLASVRAVGEHTRAGTGCGTCHADIHALLERGVATPEEGMNYHRSRWAR